MADFLNIGVATPGKAVEAKPAEVNDAVLKKSPQGPIVSVGDGNVDWDEVREAGAGLAFVKATEGTTWSNDLFTSQSEGSLAADLMTGSYHFAIPTSAADDGKAQARHFIEVSKGWKDDRQTLPGAVFLVDNPKPNSDPCYGLERGQPMITWISDFVMTYAAEGNRYPIIHTTSDWWTTCARSTTAFSATCALWLPESKQPPGGWSRVTFVSASEIPASPREVASPASSAPAATTSSASATAESQDAAANDAQDVAVVANLKNGGANVNNGVPAIRARARATKRKRSIALRALPTSWVTFNGDADALQAFVTRIDDVPESADDALPSASPAPAGTTASGTATSGKSGGMTGTTWMIVIAVLILVVGGASFLIFKVSRRKRPGQGQTLVVLQGKHHAPEKGDHEPTYDHDGSDPRRDHQDDFDQWEEGFHPGVRSGDDDPDSSDSDDEDEDVHHGGRQLVGAGAGRGHHNRSSAGYSGKRSSRSRQGSARQPLLASGRR